MLRIEADQIKGKAVRPAPMGTETHQARCLVYEDAPGSLAPFCLVTVKDQVLTAKTMRGLKGAAARAGLVWSEHHYLP